MTLFLVLLIPNSFASDKLTVYVSTLKCVNSQWSPLIPGSPNAGKTCYDNGSYKDVTLGLCFEHDTLIPDKYCRWANDGPATGSYDVSGPLYFKVFFSGVTGQPVPKITYDSQCILGPTFQKKDGKYIRTKGNAGTYSMWVDTKPTYASGTTYITSMVVSCTVKDETYTAQN